MSEADEFIKYCSQVLEANYGTLSSRIIKKVKSKKNLDDTSKISDYEEFIDLLELILSVISEKGGNEADIFNDLRKKAMELSIGKEAMDIRDILDNEALELNINEFLAKINATDLCTPVAKQKLPESSINNKIKKYLINNTLPTEGDITRFATNLAMKHDGDVKKIKRDIIEKVKIHVKDAIGKKVIRREINNFLARYPQPAENDIDDFVNYIGLLKLNFQEDEFRQQIEKERLYLRFHEPQCVVEFPELDQLMEEVEIHCDKNDIGKAMQERGLSYLIKDEYGVSDKLLIEFIELLMLVERDASSGVMVKEPPSEQ